MIRFRDLQFSRWLVLVLGFVFWVSAISPSIAYAKVEYVNGSGTTEGDPGDGNGFSSGSGDFDIGDDLGGVQSDSRDHARDLFIGNEFVLFSPLIVGTQIVFLTVDLRALFAATFGGAE